MDKEKYEIQYKKHHSKFKRIEEEAKFTLTTILENIDIKVHSVISRIKTIDSLFEKAASLELTNEDEVFEEIYDIVGLRIICLFVSDLEKIKSVIRKNFDTVFDDNKLYDGKDTDFGYFSIHFKCKFLDTCVGPRYDGLKNTFFEIQIRTITMDAWANISHYLDYKSDTEIPKSLKKDFIALSGLFYVADTHFEMFFKSKKEQSQIAQKDLKNNFNYEINFEVLEAYLNTKFKKREKAKPEAISTLVQELNAAGYKAIKDLDETLSHSFEKAPEKDLPVFLNRVGVVRRALRKFDSNYKKVHDEYLKQRRKKS